MAQPVDGLYLNKYVDPQLLIERRNYRADFMQVLGSVPAGALAADGVRRNKLINNVGFRVNNTEDFEPKQMTGKNYIVPWEIYDTEPSSCTDDEIRYLAFDKRAAIRVKHNEAFQVGIRNHVLHKLAPEDDSNEEMPVIRTTGEKDINGRLRLSYKDLVDFATLAKTWNLPVTDALYMVLSPLHMGDKFFENNDCPFYNAETAKKVAEGTKPSAETDFQASTFFYAPNTYYHIESVKSLYRPETTDTRSKSPTSEYRTQTYGIVDRIEDFGVGAILSGKSV